MGKIKEKFIEAQEENKRMDMDFLDYQSRQGRLNKRKAKRNWYEILEKIMITFVVLYFTYFVYQAIVYIFSNVYAG